MLKKGRRLPVQRNLRKVFPRVCKTDFTQMPMAACSFPLEVRGVPLRTFTVLRTFLMQRQKLDVRDILLFSDKKYSARN